MEQYISTTQLKQELREVKRLARTDVVHVMENGRAAYVLCGRDVYERRLCEAREKAAWQAGVEYIANESIDDITNGRTEDLSTVIEYDGTLARPLRVVESAASDVRSYCCEYDASMLVGLTEKVSLRPEMGLSIEYDGEPKNMRKLFVPPYDVLYLYDDEHNQIVLLGMVRSLSNIP